MGPRSHDRGNCIGWRSGTLPTPSFNGAAVARPRKCEEGGVRYGTAERFNGAAVARPRKWIIYDAIAKGVGPLQWGRGRTTAEIALQLRIARVAQAPLQWGRGRTTAEMAEGSTAWMSNLWLQWGRGRTTAEIGAGGGLPVGLALASMGPRSHDRGNEDSAGQRSPRQGGFNGAAVARPRKSRASGPVPPLVRQASMGPRSHDRGNWRGSA